MNRLEFLKKVIRYFLFGLLAFVAAITGSRAVLSGAECSACTGKGICGGISDCSRFLQE